VATPWSEESKRRLTAVGSVGAGILAWELYASRTQSLFVPHVLDVAAAFLDQLGSSEFWTAYRETLLPFLLGWTSAIAVGVLVGLLVGLSPAARSIVAPYFTFFNSVPLATFLPVLVIAFGIGLGSRTLVVFLFAVVDVFFTTASGVAYVDRDLLVMSRSFGLGRARRFRRIVVPGALPSIVSAVRLGTGRAVLGMVVMELLLVSVGVGRLVGVYRDTFRSPELYALLASLAVFGLTLLVLVRRLERLVHRGRPTAYGVNS